MLVENFQDLYLENILLDASLLVMLRRSRQEKVVRLDKQRADWRAGDSLSTASRSCIGTGLNDLCGGVGSQD